MLYIFARHLKETGFMIYNFEIAFKLGVTMIICKMVLILFEKYKSFKYRNEGRAKVW